MCLRRTLSATAVSICLSDPLTLTFHLTHTYTVNLLSQTVREGTLFTMTREKELIFARLSEQSQRYDEMVEHMEAVVKENEPLNIDERNMLSIAFKNVVGMKRASWRFLLTSEQREEVQGDTHDVELIRAFKQKIEGELGPTCLKVVHLVDDYLLKNSPDDDAKVVYHKMKGDYFRYLAEFTEGAENEAAASAAHESYHVATELAQDLLPPTHPLRLGLALNFSVFYYEILSSAERACNLAREAFDDAVRALDSAEQEEGTIEGSELYQDAELIMQLLRDNLTFWQNDLNLAEREAAEAAKEAEQDS